MFGELVGGKGHSGGQEKDWMAHMKEDMSVTRMKFERGESLLRRPADGCGE